ncbi:MAG: DUF2231 domain-containing protein [Parachlamydiaceae bacterium]
MAVEFIESVVKILGLLHPIVIHFPIVFLVVLFVWDAFFFFKEKRAFFYKFKSILLILSMTAVLSAFLTGLALENAYPENEPFVERHKLFAIFLLIFVSIYGLLWFFISPEKRVRGNALFFVFSLLLLVLVSFTADYGAIIMRDSTLFQTKFEPEEAIEPKIVNFDNKNTSIESLRTFLKESIDQNEVQAVFERNKCASCHAKKFLSENFSGFAKGRKPWISVDEKGNIIDLEKSPFYINVIKKNTMPPKGEVREEAGLSVSERLILLEWLQNNLKLRSPEI